MAEVDGQEKTEEASGKKLSESRDKGQVAKSVEINSFAIFTTGLLLVFMMQKHIGGNLANFSTSIFRDLDKLKINQQLLVDYCTEGLGFYLETLAPLFIGLVIVSLAAGYGQVGFKITPGALKPKMSKFNPFSNFKSIFFSSRSFVEVAKSLLKLFVISWFTYSVLKDFILSAVGLVDYSIEEIVKFMLEAAYQLLWKVSLVFAFIAGIDFGFQKFKFKRDLMMTKQEVKEEHKSTEGDPQIKSRIRRMQITSARQRMMKNLPTADVVITNPTHFAIALKYDLGKDSAPRVVAKGMDELAQRIKKIASEHNIPLHEDRELARALYKVCEVGDEIPQDLFKAVAQILAYIYKLKNNRKKSIV